MYYSWEDQLKTNPSGNVPYTPSLMLLHGLQETLALLREEGMANVTARHHRLAEGTRKAVEGWGLGLLCKQPRWRSDSLTVIEVPAGVDSNLIVKNAYARWVAWWGSSLGWGWRGGLRRIGGSWFDPAGP